MPGVERELALVIVSAHPGDVARRIAAERRVAGYRLIPRGARAMRDIHLDTPDGQLAARRLALRVRTAGGAARRLTLKGPSVALSGGGLARSEREWVWSGETLAIALDAMASAGVRLPQPAAGAAGRDPLDVMRGVGLTVIQDRQTRRTARDIVAAENGPVLAELAIDAVVFHLRGCDVRHHEVEIEATSRGGEQVMQAVGRALMARFAPALRHHLGSKLAIGRAIERLYRAGALDALLGSDGALTRAAYDALEPPRPVRSPAG